ncbi:MAG: hypothetical protein O2973_02445 [Gemmatimonadetes bacterium]|nr:hypothetical protein [Gemmatimonadota bacterium]
MKRIMMIAALVGASAMASAVAMAQDPPVRGQGRRGGRVGQQRPDSMQRNRAMLEQQVQQRLGQVMQNGLGASDEQMLKVREINARYSGRRRVLLDQERDIRMSLREEIVRADSSDQTRVASLLDRMLTAQRQRIDLLEQEQRDLAGVLSPLQRASYIGLEEQLRQRMEAMRAAGGRAGRGGPAGGPPSGSPNRPPQPGALGRRGPPPNDSSARRPPPPTDEAFGRK